MTLLCEAMSRPTSEWSLLVLDQVALIDANQVRKFRACFRKGRRATTSSENRFIHRAYRGTAVSVLYVYHDAALKRLSR